MMADCPNCEAAERDLAAERERREAAEGLLGRAREWVAPFLLVSNAGPHLTRDAEALLAALAPPLPAGQEPHHG